MWIKLSRTARVLAALSTLCPIAVAASQPAPGQRIAVEFIAQGDERPEPQARPERNEANVFEEGNIVSSSTILDALKNAPPAVRPPGKYRNAALSVSVGEIDGDVRSMQPLAFCRDLDLYSDPHEPDHIKARCDNDVFEYSVAGHGISFLRNNEEIATFALSGGIYAVNGAIVRIPASE